MTGAEPVRMEPAQPAHFLHNGAPRAQKSVLSASYVKYSVIKGTISRDFLFTWISEKISQNKHFGVTDAGRKLYGRRYVIDPR